MSRRSSPILNNILEFIRKYRVKYNKPPTGVKIHQKHFDTLCLECRDIVVHDEFVYGFNFVIKIDNVPVITSEEVNENELSPSDNQNDFLFNISGRINSK